jgi:hypothetical protein
MAFPDPIVAGSKLIVPAIESVDYIPEGITGWQIARDGSATFNNLNLLGDIGATNVNADYGNFVDVTLPNYDSLTATLELLDPTNDNYPMAKGLLAYGRDNTGNATITAYPFGTLAIRAHFEAGRAYRVNFRGRIGSIPATDTLFVRLSYTIDNTIPAYSGGTSGTLTDVIVPVSGTSGFIHTSNVYENPTSDRDFWIAAFINRAAGAGALTAVEITTSPNTWEIWIEDIGLANVRTATPVSYYAAPSTPPAPATKTYTKTYYATWSRTYDGDLTTTWDDSAYCYQGEYSQTRGITRSLIGFDYAQIQSDLTGASIVSSYLTIKGAHAYYNAGFTCYWGTHSYTAKPSTWSGGSVNERRGSVSGLAAGESVKINLGGTVAGELRSGVSKGIAIGPPSTNTLTYYGYLYGATQSGKPYITLTYTK